MMSLYNRRETAGQIVFEFHFLPVANLLFLLAILAALAPGCAATRRALRRCGILLMLWVAGLLPAWMEIERAMSRGSVMVSGSKFSFTIPLKVVISKA
jgi:uncharacterized membrane protein YoaK (UPF0700 family)